VTALVACPDCGAALQRIGGQDGYLAVRALDLERRNGTVIERRLLDVVHACPACEYIRSGDCGVGVAP
jgi:uncharacterized protein YbaR (Trm112 family)